MKHETATDKWQRTSGRVSETRFSLLEQRVGGMELSVNNLAAKIDLWMASKAQSSWKLVGFIAAILIPLAFVVNLYITSAISPWAAIANQAKATTDSNTVTLGRVVEDMGVIKSQNATSIQDRADKGIAITKLVDVTTDTAKLLASEAAQRIANEAEFETQVDSQAQSLNTLAAELFRRSNDAQNALHDMGATMPPALPGPFNFPNISNRNHRKQ
jgi:hypothetical protein